MKLIHFSHPGLLSLLFIVAETGVWDCKGQPKSFESYELNLENMIRMTDHSNK